MPHPAVIPPKPPAPPTRPTRHPGGHRRRCFCLSLGLLAAAGLVPGAPFQTLGVASAATVLALDLEGLVQRADVIAVGRVGESQARREPNTGLIVTDVDFGVVRPLKGDVSLGDRIVITTLGGRLPDLALSVPGEAVFAPRETALVFLRRTRHGELRVVGMAQGRMPVTGQGDSATVNTGRGDLLALPKTDLTSPRGQVAGGRSDTAGRAGQHAEGAPTQPATEHPAQTTRPLRAVIADITALLSRSR